MNTFGRVLKELRVKNGMTQGDLANRLEISRSAISMYENGEREPDFETMEFIADIFGTDMNYLYGKEDENKEFDIDAQKIASKIKGRENLKILFDKIDDLSDEEIDRIAKIIELTIPKKEDDQL